MRFIGGMDGPSTQTAFSTTRMARPGPSTMPTSGQHRSVDRSRKIKRSSSSTPKDYALCCRPVPMREFQVRNFRRQRCASPASVPFYTSLFNLYQNAPGAGRATPLNNLGCDGFTDATSGLGITQPCALAFTSTVGQLSTEYLIHGTDRSEYWAQRPPVRALSHRPRLPSHTH